MGWIKVGLGKFGHAQPAIPGASPLPPATAKKISTYTIAVGWVRLSWGVLNTQYSHTQYIAIT